MSQLAEPSGSIYDLGYRRYEGQRLGRRHAIESLYWFSLRAAFGIGRRTSSKIIPMAIAIIAAIPAVIQLGIGAIIPADQVSIIKPENYFDFIQVTVALFCAAIAPEVIGRDQRKRTLPLYFSRAMTRRDYVLAKFGALVTALLVLTVLPEVVLFFGNSLASKDAAGFWQDNWLDLPRVLVSGVMAAALFAALSLLIAGQTSRRAYATVAIIAVFIITQVLSAIIIETTSQAVGRVAILLSPLDVVRGAVLWIFNVAPEADSVGGKVDLPGVIYFVAAVAATGIAVWLVSRRYERLSV